MPRYRSRLGTFAFSLGAVLLLGSTIAAAETVKIQGLIKARSGATLVVETKDSPNLNVVLTDSTQVGQIQGVFKVRRKQMSMAALIPGLAIQAEGNYNDQHQLVATLVKFKGDDLKQAESIQAGMHETQERSRQNSAELEKHKAELRAQNDALKQQNEALNQQKGELHAQQEKLAAQQQKIAANKAAIEAAVARFGQLDDYYILDETTVYFDNGKVNIDPKYKPALIELAQKAKTVEAYIIEVKGYASSAGNTDLNQRLSADRANNVANVLLQEGHIPLTNMLAPGAMGESQQVGNNKTAEGQAENRR